MANYSTKMRVFQRWGSPMPGTAGAQNVFVFGPRYSLHRYEDADERDALVPFDAEFTSEAKTFEDAIDNTSASYKLVGVSAYAENAFVKTADVDESITFVVGNYLDGVITVREELTDVEIGDFFAAKTEDGYDYIRITNKTVEPDGEYSDVKYTTLTLDHGLPDEFEDGIVAGSAFAKKFDSVKLSDSAVTVSGNNVTVNPVGAVEVSGTACNVLAGTMYFGYKSLYVGAASGIQLATNSGDFEDVIGKADPENPISMGIMNAFVGGASVVYYYVTAGDSADAFSKALSVAELNSTLYYLVPMTQDKTVLNLVVSHVEKMSKEDVKRWRIVLCCTPVSKTMSQDGLVVESNGVYNGYKTLKFKTALPFEIYDGTTVVVNGKTFTAVKALNNKVILTTSVDTEETIGDAEISRALSEYEYAQAISASAKSLNTFRAVDVAPKTYGFGGEVYNSMYMAPIIAGMASSVEPQAPLTNAVVPGVDDLPEMYSGMSQDLLDIMASGGAFIVTQDQRGEECYVRKQLTTGVFGGTLTQSELSMVKNFDNVSYSFSEVLDRFKGAYNVTPSLVDQLELAFDARLHTLEFTIPNDMIGPQLLEGSRVDYVMQDPTNATKILAHIICVLPAPFNEIDLYLSATVSTELTTTAESSTNA